MLTRTAVFAILIITLAAACLAQHLFAVPYSLIPNTYASIQPGPPPLTFKWSMPKRFGPKTQDGLVDYHWTAATRTYDEEYVRPRTWKVEFDACALGMAANSIYQWDVEGVVVSSPNLTACTFAHEFAAQRTYPVKLTVTAPDGGVTVFEDKVTVKDILIVSIGDSVASGQGNPDIPRKGSAPAKWVDKLCARSAIAGPAQAALSIEEADPHTSITFISFACTGAGITNGLLGKQMRASIAVPSQIEKLRETVNGRNIDALLISVGGNDLGFADLVARCILDWNCSEDKDALKQFREGLDNLQSRYQALNAAIQGLQPTTRVFITEYPDMVRNEAGKFCHRSPNGDLLWGMRIDETRWASEQVITSLNNKVSEAAKQHGWFYVGGLFERFRTHGFCAGDGARWVRTFKEAEKVQGTDMKCRASSILSFSALKECLISSGSVHPSGGGHATYSTRIIEELQRAGITQPPSP